MKLTFLYNPVCAIRRVKYKFLIVLKLTTILLLISALHLSAASYSQSVTISRKSATLETVLKDIKKQTGFLFFYNGKVNITSKTMDVELRNVPLTEALNSCLANYDLIYSIVDKTIVIRNKIADNAVIEPVNDKLEISGKVIDSVNHSTIPGVNITLKNNKAVHAQTNGNGEFKIEVSQGDILVFTFIGYKPKEVKVTDTKSIVVSLSPKINAMNDVVVTGYQVIKKDNYTGSAITIKGEDLKRLNPNDLLKSVASFDPSFRIADNNLAGSDPNVLPKISIRGSTALPSVNGAILDRNNLSSSYNLPVFILDGFEVSLQNVTDMDINRIESITLLKDAAATAVYGSRAANGVMVITTKPPKPGKLQLSYNYELTATAPDLSDYHVLDATQKLQYEKLAGLYSAVNNGATTQDALDQMYYSKLKNVVSGVNTYWLSQPLQNAYGQKHSLYAEGGDSTFRYGVTMRYQTSPGVMKGSERNRYSGGMNFNYNPNRNLLFKNEITVTEVDAANSKYGDFSTYVNMNPYYPITDANGNLVRVLSDWQIDTHQNANNQYQTVHVFNPLFEASLGNFDKSAYLEIIDAFSIDWKITHDLRLIGLMSVNENKSTSDTFVSPFSNTFYDGPTDQIQNRGSYNYGSNNNLNLDGNIRFVYNKQISDHSLNMVLGSNITSSKTDSKSFEADGFANDKFTNIGFARTYKLDSAPGGDVSLSRLAGAFFSGSYAYKNKYLLDATYRLDGSSSFGSNNRFAPFWSTGIGWNMHKEDFMANFPAISRFKVTATAGLTGSVDFPPYLSKSTYTYQTSNWYSTGIGALVNGYGNENLQWQKTTSYDIGVDLGLFNDRIAIRPDYYYKLTKGLVTDINIAPSTGFNTYKDNLGDMANKGFEVYLTANVYKTKDVNINITANVAHNTNTIVKISNSLKAYNQSVDAYQLDANNNAQGTPLLRYNEGQSLNTIYAVKSLGIDPENGKEIYVKKDGSLTYIYDITDTQPVGDATPKAEGFFGSNITYKQFLLSFSFHYRFGGDMYNQTLMDRVENADPRNNVDARALTQRWQNPGDLALYKNIADLSTSFASSRFVQKDNLIELQSVYLSYDLKKNIAKKLGMQTLRTAITANDIFHASDVQMERGINYPYARSLTLSLQATF
jgi:TonB-linked SusC/RagA family outer membrane protein